MFFWRWLARVFGPSECLVRPARQKVSKTLDFSHIAAKMCDNYRVFDIFSHLAWPEGGGGEQNEVWRQKKVKNTRLFAYFGGNVRKD